MTTSSNQLRRRGWRSVAIALVLSAVALDVSTWHRPWALAMFTMLTIVVMLEALDALDNFTRARRLWEQGL